MALIALRFDLRAPEWAATQHAEQFAACLEMAAWADGLGLDIISLSEHHGTEDGYLPAPFTLAAAVAAVTARIPITIAAAILPLHDPVRLAEQIAVVDHIARGRVSFVAGAGYARWEFEMAGVDRRERGAMLERSIEVMRTAWTGEPFDHEGRTVRVTPRPFSRPHPTILIGGSSLTAARRAARLRLPFFPALGDQALVDAYREACEAEGWHGGFSLVPNGPGFVHVTDDPERDWAEIERYAWYDASTYASWQAGGSASEVTSHAAGPEELRREGIYRVVTPDECVAMAEELGPMGSVVLHPLLCGLPLELGRSSLELFASTVLPRIRPRA